MEDFTVVQTGLGRSSSLEIVPGKNSKSLLPPMTVLPSLHSEFNNIKHLNQVPVGLPPVLKTQEEELEDLLSHPETLPIHDFKKLQELVDEMLSIF